MNIKLALSIVIVSGVLLMVSSAFAGDKEKSDMSDYSKDHLAKYNTAKLLKDAEAKKAKERHQRLLRHATRVR